MLEQAPPRLVVRWDVIETWVEGEEFVGWKIDGDAGLLGNIEG